ncbi:MAG: serine/threonine-protein kinase [Candidatus Eisenbacteria bacterium]
MNLGSAVVILALALSPRVTHTVALHAGLAGEVLSCWAISFVAIQGVYEETGAVPHLTWASIVIVVFPMIIPLPPGRLLIAAILSAASAPLSGLLLQATGRIALTTEALVGISISPALAVGIAFAGARMIYAINVDISRARRMGAYRLEEKLGAGGMGEVWRASHRMLARPAAVKLIAPRQLAGNPDLARRTIQRFEQEVQATARLRSPHTVEVYDYGIADDGSFYYVMELLEGRNLQDLVARHGPLPAARVVPILRQACHSLGEAHQAGLVHRDVKPANMVLCRYGADADFLKILDFGLVKDPQRSGDSLATQQHQVVGTPAFLAPEVALGREVDGRTDLYALGCVAYWLLTGLPVFEAESPLGLVAKHIEETPIPLSRRTELEIPTALEAIVLDCLSKDPADRPPSAEALAERLDAFGGSVWTQQDARSWWARHEPVG